MRAQYTRRPWLIHWLAPCAPVQRRIWRGVFAAHPIGSRGDLQRAALELWRGATFREERYAAIGPTGLRRYAQWQDMRALPMYEEMIVTGAWWDYVDGLATHHLGNVLRGSQITNHKFKSDHHKSTNHKCPCP